MMTDTNNVPTATSIITLEELLTNIQDAGLQIEQLSHKIDELQTEIDDLIEIVEEISKDIGELTYRRDPPTMVD